MSKDSTSIIHACFEFRGMGEDCKKCSVPVKRSCELMLNIISKLISGNLRGLCIEDIQDVVSESIGHIQKENFRGDTDSEFAVFIRRIFNNKRCDHFRTPKNSPDFCIEEFNLSLPMEDLCKVVSNDNYNISLSAPVNTIGWLNELLCVPNYYNNLILKKPDLSFSGEVKKLVEKTKDYRSNPDNPFHKLNQNKKYKIKRLNRLLLEETYPNQTPKSLKNKLKIKPLDLNDDSHVNLEDTKQDGSLTLIDLKYDIESLKKVFRKKVIEGKLDERDIDIMLHCFNEYNAGLELPDIAKKLNMKSNSLRVKLRRYRKIFTDEEEIVFREYLT